MKKQIFLFTILLLFISSQIYAQCSYDQINIKHVDCYNDNTGEIQISITNPNVDWNWVLPDSSISTNLILSNLQSGDFTLIINEYSIPGDSTSPLICSLIDTISVEQTIPITAEFVLKNMCNPSDSADITTTIYGGTPPYSTLWTGIGDTSRSIVNIAPSITPYTLHITDTNGCERNQYLTINTVEEMQTFMSTDNVICKDDNSGAARIYVENGTPPFTFFWNTEEEFMDIESSRIENLYPGTYSVIVTDIMGCIISDSITISSNPKICIIVYSVFSPNDDGIHDYWEIENIELYPEALVEVYDRMGSMVYRRRNYINSESTAFNGYSKDGRRLTSGTYYYVLNLENGDEVFKGTLTIVR